MNLFRKGVGIAVGEVYLIALGLSKVIGERHFVVVSNIVGICKWSPNMMGLSVCYLVTSSVPVVVLASPRYTNFHPCTVQGCWFCEVAQVELYFPLAHSGSFILHTKIKPLVVASSICIHSHE